MDDGCALLPCQGCSRHVRCGERVCPFCGAALVQSITIHEFRVQSRLPRGLLSSIGAALTTAGFTVSCVSGEPLYGATPSYYEGTGGSPGDAGDGGSSGDGGSGG